MRSHGNGHHSPAEETIATLALNKGATGAGAPVYSYVLNAAATPSGNVYATWTALYAAMSAVAGAKLVEVVGTAHMTAGGPYAIDQVEFVASVPNAGVPGVGSSLIIDPGATITPGTVHFNDGLLVSYLGTGPCVTAASTAIPLVDIGRGSTLQASAAGPFIEAVAGTFAFVLVSGGATLGDGTNVAVIGQSGGGVIVQATGRAIIANDSVSGSGAVLRYEDSTQVTTSTLPGVNLQMVSQAQYDA